MLNKILDASIVFSFDRTGFRRHARNFNEDALATNLNGKQIAITGANSGIGFETARALANEVPQFTSCVVMRRAARKHWNAFGRNFRKRH